MRKTLHHLHLMGPHSDAQCSALPWSPLLVTFLHHIPPPLFLGEMKPEAKPRTGSVQTPSGEHCRAATAASGEAFELGLPGGHPGTLADPRSKAWLPQVLDTL